MTLEEYKKYILDTANNGTYSVFYNSSKEHASIVMGTIFKSSQNNVRIWAGKLNGEVSSDDYYISELKNFLERGGKVKIILDESSNEINPKLKNILALYRFLNPESIEIKTTAVRVGLTSDDEAYKHVHFTVGDDRMYRLELFPDKYTAKGNFNDKKTSSDFIRVFDDVFKSAASNVVVN